MQTTPLLPPDPLKEIAALLVSAMCRLKLREASAAENFSLDFGGTPSIHGDVINKEKEAFYE